MNKIIHISWSGPTIKLRAGKICHYFEMHKYCGPMRLYANGEPNQNFWTEGSAFWPVFNKWLNQGEKVDKNGYGVFNPK